MKTLRPALASALWALRTYRRTAALLVATGVVALAALLPVTSLASGEGRALSPRLALPPWRGGDLGMSWSPLVGTPTTTQQAALGMLFRLLLGVAAGVLAATLLNVLSLSAARASQRTTEVRVRRAVGASRRQLFSASLLESGTMAAGVLVLGGLLGAIAGRAAAAAWPGPAGPGRVTLDLMAIGATLSGIVLGAIVPLLLPRRTMPLPGPTGKPLELVVPALQLGLSLTVLTAAGLVQRDAAGLTEPGPNATAQGEVFQLTAPQSPPARRAAAYAALIRGLGAQPGVTAVSLTSPGTVTGLGIVDVATTDCGACAIDGIGVPWLSVPAVHFLVSADTFRTLGLKLVAGRGLTDADDWEAPRVAVVSRFTALHDFEPAGAVGRRISIGRPATWYTVVGVVDDREPAGFGGGLQSRHAVYLSVLQHPAQAVDLHVRATDAETTAAAVEHGLRDSLDPAQTGVLRASMSQLVGAEAAPLRWFGRAFRMEGWITLAIAILGTFVVMRLWLESLRYELGVRRAVGARRRRILGFVLVRALAVAVGGVAIGLWLGLILWEALATAIPGVPPWDVAFALRIAPLLAVATLAGALPPAWQAVRAAPASLVAAAD